MAADEEAGAARQWFVGGEVQGVGFRWWTRSRALELGLSGYARNLRDGRVEVFAQGRADSLAALGALLEPLSASEDRSLIGGPSARPGEVAFATGRSCSPRPEIASFTER